MKVTRRNFLKGSLATLFLAGSGIPDPAKNKVAKEPFKKFLLVTFMLLRPLVN